MPALAFFCCDARQVRRPSGPVSSLDRRLHKRGQLSECARSLIVDQQNCGTCVSSSAMAIAQISLFFLCPAANLLFHTQKFFTHTPVINTHTHNAAPSCYPYVKAPTFRLPVRRECVGCPLSGGGGDPRHFSFAHPRCATHAAILSVRGKWSRQPHVIFSHSGVSRRRRMPMNDIYHHTL